MDNDTKTTFAVIVALIVILGTLAYFLRGAGTGQVDTYTQATTTASTISDTIKTPNTSTTTSSMSTSSTPVPEKVTRATITTSKGVIEVTFVATTPLTVQNFAKLAASGFYDGVRFHRVIKDFMIQTGDPLSKDLAMKDRWGTGGPGYRFADELTGQEQYPLGTLAMANAGPDTNGSQFFIVTANPGYPLPPNYTVFGHVTKGIETALAIQGVQTDATDKPLEDVVIESVTIR
jgi:cyclophilin family peptidyl-prolyl cis-trans isomerase